MKTFRFLTSGESHGQVLLGIVEGVPSGLSILEEDLNIDLKRRQTGYGRGGRMSIESDKAKFLSGVRWGRTIGSPISVLIENKDWVNWAKGMSPYLEDSKSIKPITRPRPGHADLAGVFKYGHRDIRDVLERSSARETAMRVAIGAIAKRFLKEFDIKILSYVLEIGGIRADIQYNSSPEKLYEKSEASTVRCPDEQAMEMMIKKIDEARERGDSIGGIFEVAALNVPPGLGSYVQWEGRLDGRLAYTLMSIQAIKGVEIGLGFEMARRFGSEVMDEIFYRRQREQRTKNIIPPTHPSPSRGEDKGGGESLGSGLWTSGSNFYRKTNYAGGIEGGVSNGLQIVARCAMKPIPTLQKPLSSVDIITKEEVKAAYERSDICAVPAASIVGEAMVAITIADAFLEKFSGDSMAETRRNYESYISAIKDI